MTERPGANPRMSVVIPHYNHAHLASEALAAIAQQTMLPFEVVLVDDGSTDDSVVRLQPLAASMPYLRIYRHPENRGVNAACNTGLDLVSGDFVLFSAADDRLSAAMIQHAFAAAAAFPEAGVIFSDHAEMSADGSSTRIVPLDLPTTRRYFSADEFVRLMQNHFFYFHVSSVWFNAALLRELGGFPLDVKWHGDLLAAYAAAFELGAVYTPDSVSYVRISPLSYGAAGSRSSAQLEVLRAWLRVTKRPGWERRRAAFIKAAIWPDYRLRSIRILLEDPGYITLGLARRLIWLSIWTRLAPVFGTGFRRWVRAARTQYRRWLWRTH
jgi:glycosyltransferase involved in cell wall biosynthesis